MLAAARIPLVDLEIPVEIVVLGLVTGLTYGLLGIGLSLVYRTSRVINFAHGEIGALPAVVVPVLVINHGWSYWLALPLALAGAAALGATTERVVIRRLQRAPRLIVLVATIGVAQILLVANLLIPREGALAGSTYPVPFDFSFTIGTYVVTPGQLLILLVVPLAAAAITYFLGRTRLGMASRAAAENREAALLSGVPVNRVSLLMWTIVGLSAGVSAVLAGPTQPLLTQVALGPSLMVRALAAAMIGGLVRLPAVFVGGIAIGVLESVIAFNHPTGGVLELVLFVVIVGSLLVRRDLGQKARGSEESSWSLAGAVRSLPRAVAEHPRVQMARRSALATALLFAALLPLSLDNSQLVLAASVVLFALMGTSLVVLTGYAGQVSLGQFALVGLGAVVGGRVLQLGYPPWMGVLYATAAGGVAALLVGLPALRIRGLYLAVTTLAFAVAAGSWLFGQDWLVAVEGDRTSLTIPRPVLFGVDLQQTRNYYWLCLAVFVVVAAMVVRLRRTGLGRAMVAVRDNEPAAATVSVSPRRVRLVAFVISGMIAALGGYFYGGLLVTFGSGTFSPVESLNLLAMVVFGGITSVTGALLGALWVQGIPYLFGSNIGLLSSGAGLLVVLLVFPGGLASLAFRVRDRVATRLAADVAVDGGDEDIDSGSLPVPTLVSVDGPETPHEPAAETSNGHRAAVPLEARQVCVRYGGIVAVRDVDLVVGAGEAVGLIGPNGAGKTTLFDALAGHVTPDDGQILLHGEDITTLRPESRALLGMGRTFQHARLFGDLTVRECFRLALERDERSEVVPSLLGLPPSRTAEKRKVLRADEMIDLLGLGAFADLRIAELSTGTRRMVELGTVAALGADVLLLDEPMAGIAQREVEAFVPVIGDLRRHLGASMLIVDHDIPMITAIVDRLYVMSAGSVIAEGDPAAVQADEAVIAAYLGTDERAVARSGAVPGQRGRPTTTTGGT